jgi:hypothetical protein
MLARLFRHGQITYHGGFISLASGRMSPLSVDKTGRRNIGGEP